MQLRTQRTVRVLFGLVILALVVTGLVAILRVLSRGPDASRFPFCLLLKDVQGLQAGSRVVHRGMTVGHVAALDLDAAAGRVRVFLSLDEGARDLARTTSQLWVVRPRFAGIAKELSGLDTLVKESYLRLRAREGGSLLEPGDELLGMEGPPPDLAEEDLDDPLVGDLLATVVLPEAHGITTGSPVLYHGLRCGEVRSLRLSSDGRGILVRIRVHRDHRHLVRDKSRVWVVRPILQGSLLTGVTVTSLGSLLASAMEFDSPPAARSEPAADNSILIGLEAPPSDREAWEGDKVASQARVATPSEHAARMPLLEPWVTVRYRAIEKDTFENDEVQATGEGVLFRSQQGELCVLTARSACDGSFLIEDHWYDRLRLADERIRIVLADGRIWPAKRIWVDPADKDLAVLQVQAASAEGTPRLAPWSSYLDFAAPATDAPRGDSKTPVVLQHPDGRAFALVGQVKTDAEQRVVVPFAALPEALRPGDG